MAGHLRAYIELRGYGARGPRYQVRMNRPDGMVIIESTTEPLFDAARALLSKGITGKLEMWDSTRAFPRMRGDIERLATLTVSETQNGIALRKYAERTGSGGFEESPIQGARNEIGPPGSVLQASAASVGISAPAKEAA